jgi:N-methylhydantoinase A
VSGAQLPSDNHARAGVDDATRAFIGVDVGGTHTDVEVVLGGNVARGKALTTYADFSRGVLEAVEVAGAELGLTLVELLGRTELILNGTTVVTNVVTEMRGSRVGVLVTAGFKDTFRIAGGPRLSAFDDHLQTNVPELVPRRAIAEIDGRIDYAGVERVPLDLDQVREAGRRLVEEEKVEALAVCFLMSYVDPTHELRAESLLREAYPDLFVSLSHRVYAVQGETRRWTTAVLNSFVHADAQIYLDTIATRLSEAGLAGRVAFFQGLGGAISLERARRIPLALLGSGPAGGAIGANALARRMGVSHVLVGDMGGTSFDTGIVRDNDVPIAQTVDIGRLRTGISLVDVKSIGAGGGSIVWVSDRGVPQVGPHSASSTPGPVCYGRGGVEPTVTDAMVVLGFIDPDNYLGGRLPLHVDLARDALAPIGERFGWTVEETAAAVHDLVVTSMANAIHEVSVERGHDPREFMFLAYGGTLPMFGAQIGAEVGIAEVVIPRNSSVFCARGLLSADFVVRRERTVGWSLDDADRLDQINEIAGEMVAEAMEEMRAEGFAPEAVTQSRSGRLRFFGQVYELPVALPDRDLTAEDVPRLGSEFRDMYERVYGPGTAWKGAGVQVSTLTVTLTGMLERDALQEEPETPTPAADVLLSQRTIYLPSTRTHEMVGVYDGRRFTPGTSVTGPAIIDETDTTIFVPEGLRASRDRFLNYRLVQEDRA